VYVDLAVGHGWNVIRPGTLEFHVIDMDLDVIRSVTRGVYIDDEDEFAEHQVAMEYPPDLVDRMLEETQQLYQAVKAQHAPFDGTDAEWFRRGRA
jgi:protein associated with RNAse G/E